MKPNASAFVTLAMVVLTFSVAAAIVLGSFWAGRSLNQTRQRTLRVTLAVLLGVAAWLGVTLALANSGLLANFDARPPPGAMLIALCLVLSVALALSAFGKRLAYGLPLWALVGFHAFRLPLEIVMNRTAREGVMPIQMSFSGFNFDIVSGVTALVVAFLIARKQEAYWLVVAWQVLGFTLLVAIAVIAIVSTPFVASFGSAPERLNTWVFYAPFVWLPTVLVAAALFGHVVLLRRLLEDRRQLTASSTTGKHR